MCTKNNQIPSLLYSFNQIEITTFNLFEWIYFVNLPFNLCHLLAPLHSSNKLLNYWLQSFYLSPYLQTFGFSILVFINYLVLYFVNIFKMRHVCTCVLLSSDAQLLEVLGSWVVDFASPPLPLRVKFMKISSDDWLSQYIQFLKFIWYLMKLNMIKKTSFLISEIFRKNKLNSDISKLKLNSEKLKNKNLFKSGRKFKIHLTIIVRAYKSAKITRALHHSTHSFRGVARGEGVRNIWTFSTKRMSKFKEKLIIIWSQLGLSIIQKSLIV